MRRKNNNQRNRAGPDQQSSPAGQETRKSHWEKQPLFFVIIHPGGQREFLSSRSKIRQPRRVFSARTVQTSLLLAVHGNATVGALRTAEGARLGWHKDLIRELVDGDAVRVGTRGYIDEPLAPSGIDHAENGSIRHVSARCVIAVVAAVVPDLVSASGLIDVDLAGEARSACGAGTVKDNHQRRKLDAVVTTATDKEIVAGALCDSRRHAIVDGDNIDHDWSLGFQTSIRVDPGINLINAADSNAGLHIRISSSRAIQVFYIESTVQRIEAEGTRSRHGNFT